MTKEITSTATHPYLDGNFAPVDREITLPNLMVTGELPQDLSGWFLRNGPNPQFAPLSPYHWFDGDGMLHAVKIANGKASYRNRYVRTLAFEKEQVAGRALWTGLLSPPQKDNPYGLGKNSANTALVYHHGKLLALWEGGLPHQIHPHSLKTLGEYNFHGHLTSAFTAHPKVDPLTGEMMFFGYSLVGPPYLNYTVVSARGELLRTVAIDLPVGVMMHDFAITENYSIFLDLPLTFSLARIQQGKLAFAFEPDRPSRFGILPRHGDNSNIRWFSLPACYVLHTLNAYEDGDEVVLIAGRMNSVNLLYFSEKYDNIKEDKTVLYRWRFNFRTGTVKEEILSDLPIDFPSLNQGFLGRKMRYGYAAKRAPSPRFLFDALIKYDFSNGLIQTHQFGTGRYGGEAVFVPRSNARAEDDGWLLTFVYDETSKSSELLVLDAADFPAPPVARIAIPARVPYGFHGLWIGRSQLLTALASDP